ncbi:MAG: NAD(P)H-quinone oxidoreductase [Anaerolineae bacterium]
MKMMRAIMVKNPGGVEDLYITEQPRPILKPNEILIKVQAVGVNRADIFQRQGHYPPPKGVSPILGLEVAGIVEEVGSLTTRWRKGDRVMSLLEGGGYAEFAAADEKMTLPIPKNLSFIEGAAIPEAFLTAYQVLVIIGELKPNDWVLIHAGASGVGTAAIQIVKALKARSIVTAGSEEKVQACLKLGCEAGFNYREGPFQDNVLKTTKDHGVDLIMDFVGASYFEQNLKVLAQSDKMILISLLGGSKVDQIDLQDLIGKWATLTGTTLRSRPLGYKAGLIKAFEDFALRLLENGELKPLISHVFPWEKVQEAHRFMQEGHNIGKIVLQTEVK